MAEPAATTGRSRRTVAVVYAAGTIQGIVLVTVPAASTILTEPSHYDLSSSQYGLLFLPQVITAVSAALVGAALARRLGNRPIYLAGLALGLLAMLALLVSAAVMREPIAYPLLLLCTASLGAGFGLTVPAINSLTAELHPGAVNRSVLTLNALLGVGTALAPIFVAVFTSLGFWWGLPLLSTVLLAVLLLVSAPLPLGGRPAAVPAAGRAAGRAIPNRFWAYGIFAVLYGICETVNGNWSQLDLTEDLGASATVASLALTAFWTMVTVGRLLFAWLERWIADRWTYRVLPFALCGVFLLIAGLPRDRPVPAVLAFALAGLACSALLPLTISFGQRELSTMGAAVAGGVIAAYQLGYGIAAFGVGPLHAAGVSLPDVYRAAAVIAAALGLVSLAVTRRVRSNTPL